MRIVRISSTEQWMQLAEPWHCVSRGVPFRSLAWLGNWWRCFSQNSELFVIAAFNEQGLLVGVAPLFRETTATGARVLKLLGSGTVCSDYLSILATPEYEDAVCKAFAQWLLDAVNPAEKNAAEENGWDLLELSGVTASDLMVAKLVEHLSIYQCTIHFQAGLNCWRISLPDTWDQYLASLSKSHRKQVRRVETRMLNSGKAILHTANSPKSISRGMEILVDLHQRRRQSLGEAGCFSDERFREFLSQAALQLGQEHCLELHWIEVEGRAVAAEFHMVGCDVVYAYQAGIEPDALHLEPGRIINVATIKRAIELQYRAFDFLRGDESYKSHWRAEPVPTVELRVIPQKTSAQIRHGVWLAGDTVKSWLKTGLTMTGIR